MNDRRFIELINLYLDHQLDPREAAELEAEVMRNPARRRTYEQYCRVQRACSVLAERERSAAPASQAFARALLAAERKIAAPRRAWWSPVAHSGVWAASAMAACVVLVVVWNRSDSPTAGTAPGIASNAEGEGAHPAATLASAESAHRGVESSPAFDVQPMLAAANLGVVRNAREAEIAATDREAFEWMQRVEHLRLQPLVVDDQAFEARPSLHPDNRVFRSRHGIQGSTEFTAFQFQR